MSTSIPILKVTCKPSGDEEKRSKSHRLVAW
jgi:hypothetical protein